MFDLVMITTCTCSSYISNLLKSITVNNTYINILVIAVLQNKVQVLVNKTANTNIQTIELDNIISLSKARNIALQHLIQNQISYDYIMFPDDDSSFDTHFFANFKNCVKPCSLIDVYGTGTQIHYKKHKMKHGETLSIGNHQNAMSVNMIIDSNTQRKVGEFDEMLGVGTYYGAGEDNDYYIRCIKAGATFYYIDNLWTFHPLNVVKNKDIPLSKLIFRYQSYGRGAIRMFLKHQMKMEALMCITQGFGGIVSAILKLDVKLACARVFGVYSRIKTYIQY